MADAVRPRRASGSVVRRKAPQAESERAGDRLVAAIDAAECLTRPVHVQGCGNEDHGADDAEHGSGEAKADHEQRLAKSARAPEHEQQGDAGDWMGNEQRQIEDGRQERAPAESPAREQVRERRSPDNGAEGRRGRGQQGERERTAQLGVGAELPNA